MSLINLFWQLDITDETKYLLIFFVIICVVVCAVYRKKKKNNTNKNKKYLNKNKNTNMNENNNHHDEYYNEYLNKRNQTKCHQKYMNCVENNMKNGTDEFCYPCLNNGLKPDFFYNPVSKEWVSREDDS
jgi:hypothetical protein